MYERRLVVAWLTFLSISFSFCGCYRSDPLPAGMPPLQPVQITVLQAGQPLAYASIRLIPEDAKSAWNSGGSTDETGVAMIRTHGKYEGAPVGKYKVTVTKIETPPPANNHADPLAASTFNDPSSYDLVAPRYTYPNQTPLLLEVVSGMNRQELDLGVPVRIKRKGPPS